MKKTLNSVLIVIAGVLLLCEDWFWSVWRPWVERWAQHPTVAKIEAKIKALQGYEALSAFALPIIALFPFKFAALFVLAKGHIFLGGIVLILAKLCGGTLAARIYALTAPQLLQIDWFARAHAWFFAFRARIYAALDNMPSWQNFLVRLASWRARMQAWRERNEQHPLFKRLCAAIRYKRSQKSASDS